MFNEELATWHRVAWVLLALFCLGLATTQITDRIRYYLTTPIGVSLVVATNETLVFPRLTICSREPFNYTAMEELRPLVAQKLAIDQDEVKLPYDLVSLMPLDELWNRIGHKMDVMTKEVKVFFFFPLDKLFLNAEFLARR